MRGRTHLDFNRDRDVRQLELPRILPFALAAVLVHLLHLSDLLRHLLHMPAPLRLCHCVCSCVGHLLALHYRELPHVR